MPRLLGPCPHLLGQIKSGGGAVVGAVITGAVLPALLFVFQPIVATVGVLVALVLLAVAATDRIKLNTATLGVCVGAVLSGIVVATLLLIGIITGSPGSGADFG